MKVTIFTCTPDIRSSVFKKHSASIKKYTKNFEWLIFDNNSASDFKHAHEINKAISIVKDDYLVIIDDDVIVTENWLESLLNLVDNAEIIGGIHRYENGEINHSGGYVLSDGSAGHYTGYVKTIMYVHYVCSAVMLINLGFVRKNNINFDERFLKFFHETDFCLNIWKSGGKVAITSECDVFHLIGKSIEKWSNRIKLYSLDSFYFKEKWVETKKLNSLMIKISKQLNNDYNNSVKEISKLLLDYKKAIENRDTEELKKVNKESKRFFYYDHGRKLNADSAVHIKEILT